MITVVCWKWNNGTHPKKGIMFGAEHVNKLQSMLERNCSLPFRFVCITDDWKGLSDSISIINIDRHFSNFKGLGGCYRRLRAFDLATAAALFGGRFLSIDLDTVITGDVTDILSFKEEFRIWCDTAHRRTPYCGSLWGMKPGVRQAVWDVFCNNPTDCIQKARGMGFVGTDQAHISAQLWPSEVTWGAKDGIFNFNTQVRRSVRSVMRRNDGQVVERLSRDGTLPDGTRIVFFNGKYDPSQPLLQSTYEWIGDHWR